MKKLSPEAEKLRTSILSQFTFDDDAALAILETGLRALDLMNAAQKVVDKDGLTVQGDRGGVKAHPLLAVIRDQRAQFMAAVKQLRLNIDDGEIRKPGRPTSFERFRAGKGI